MNIEIKKTFFQESFNVSRETLEKFTLYHEILIHNQRIMNLIGKGSVGDIWIRHFCDSAKIFVIIKGVLGKKNISRPEICDVGSGAGFPGMVINLLMEMNDCEFRMDLVESISKKCIFLENLKKSLHVKARIINERIENLDMLYDIIVCRAVAPLKRFFPMVFKNLKKESILIIPKGKSWKSELGEVKNNWKFLINIVKNNKSIDSSGGVTLVIRNLKKR